MKTKLKTRILNVLAAAALLASTQPGRALDTDVTFQGVVTDLSGQPAAGGHSLKFSIWSAETGGIEVWQDAQPRALTIPADGLVTEILPTPAGVFTGDPRWVQIELDNIVQSPRAKITPTPYAIHAGDAGTLAGQAPSAFVAKTGGTMTGTLTAKALSFFDHSGAGTFGSGSFGYDSSGAPVISLFGQLSISGPLETVHLSGLGSSFFVGGNVGIGTKNPSKILEVEDPGDVEIGLRSLDVGGRFWTIQSTGVRGFRNASFQIIDRTAGVARMIIDPTDGSVSVGVLKITGGADLAEPFQMSTKDIPKGAVLAIDERNPGKLRLSQAAYDTQVAGIVSGANGIKPGISLHQEGVFEGGENVALSGRVYALADASESPIKPGDLLTTSATPGHCMKVTDPARARGAIIGKAMSRLEEGKGMVLVLVTLQ